MNMKIEIEDRNYQAERHVENSMQDSKLVRKGTCCDRPWQPENCVNFHANVCPKIENRTSGKEEYPLPVMLIVPEIFQGSSSG
jgi:hypothetical protein